MFLNFLLFFHSDEKSLTFAADEKFLKNLVQTRAKVIIVPDIELPLIEGKGYIVVKDSPRVIMPKLLHFFSRTLKKNHEKILKKFAKILHSFFVYAILIYGLKKLPKTVGELDS